MDQELEDLKREIEELARLMRDLGTTVGMLDEKILEKFGIAVKKNTKAVEDNTKALQGSGKIVDQFGREIKTATEETKEAAKTQKRLNELTEKEFYERKRALGDAVRGRSRANELIDEFARAGSATSLFKQGIENLGGDSLAATAGLRVFTAGMEGAGRAVMSMAKGLYNGERGAKVSADALGEFAKTVGDAVQAVSLMVGVLSWFGPGGWIFKALKLGGAALGYLSGSAIKLAADFNKLAAEQNDRLFKSFNDLSQVGASAATGMDGVFQDLQTLGMSVAEIEKFGEIIKSNSKTLALFGATAADGTREFAKVAGGLYKSRLGEQLELMGITANDQREATLSYMSILARTGQLQGRNTDQLIKGSAAYAKELDALARLTGMSREEAAKQMEAAQADARFRAAIDDARMRGDEAALKRLELARSMSVFFESQGLSDLAAGTRALAAGGGAVTTPQAIMAMNAGVREAIESGDQNKAMQILSRTMPQFNKNVAGYVRFGGNIENFMGDYAKMADTVAKFEIIQRDFGGDFEAFNRAQKKRGKDADKSTVASVQASRMQQGAAILMDTAVKSFSSAATINKSASEAFRDAVNVFNRTVGAKPVPGGVPMTGAAPGAAGAPSTGPVMGGTRMGPAAARKRGGAGTAQPGVQGLRLKSSEAVSGGEADPRLIGLAHQIQNQLGGDLLYFSALNDTFERGGNSKHPQGLALDFTLRDSKYSAGSADLVRGILARSGLQGRVIDEYLNPSRSATGGHIHVELEAMARGGVLSGPRSGYPALLHGTEAVVPLPDGRSIPVQLDNRETTESLNRQLTTLQMQLGKMDEMIGVMRENNSISSKILQVSRN